MALNETLSLTELQSLVIRRGLTAAASACSKFDGRREQCLRALLASSGAFDWTRAALTALVLLAVTAALMALANATSLKFWRAGSRVLRVHSPERSQFVKALLTQSRSSVAPIASRSLYLALAQLAVALVLCVLWRGSMVHSVGTFLLPPSVVGRTQLQEWDPSLQSSAVRWVEVAAHASYDCVAKPHLISLYKV
jgi:hypothetical protein